MSPHSTKENARGNGQVTTGQGFQERKSTVSSGRSQAYFCDEILSDLRARLPQYLEAVGVELRRNGTRFVGRCPVHEDREPSFAVFGANQEVCGCYPCDFKGDVFAVSQWLGRSSTFPEAVQDVAASLGVQLSHEFTGRGTRPATAPRRTPKPPAPPFKLSETEGEKIHVARLAFSDAFWSADPIVGEIIESLGLNREALRLACWGRSGLGIASPAGLGKPWLSYAYPQGLKWRNPDPKGKPRFMWLVGKATAPWRMEWVKPETHTVYLTEGESDCLALIAAGLEADGTSVCVASPGTSFPREWAPLFKGRRVVICFDIDPPGQAATATVASLLKEEASQVLAWKGAASHV
jgi:hypothetical protein